MQRSIIGFRFSGKLAKLLGEESVSSPTVAVSELVKNSYDADATNCAVSFEGPENDMILRIRDNGHGMTYKDIVNKWMVVGTNDKEYNPISPQGRRKVGEKGIGRFAVERLGHRVEVISRPSANSQQISMIIDWDRYTQPDITFDQVTHEIRVESREQVEDHGLELVIQNLRDRWTEAELQDLQASLSMLVPPSWDEKTYQVTLAAPLLGIRKEKLESSIFREFLYHVFGNYNGNSEIQYTIEFREEGKRVRETTSSIEEGRLQCGPVDFDVYFYVLAAGTNRRYSRWVLKGPQMRKQLEKYHGMKIFRDEFRVRPYGDAGNDWLELSEWARNELYAFPNRNVIGTIKISRDESPLVDTTTREGLIRNKAFFDLKRLLKDVTALVVAQRRTDFPQEHKAISESKAIEKIDKAYKDFRSVAIDEDEIQKADDAISTIKKEVTEIENKYITQTSMYRGLASLGISLAAISHEIADPIAAILQRASRTNELLARGDISRDDSKEWWEQVRSNIFRVNEFVGFVTVFTSADERTRSSLDLGTLVKDVVDGYKSIFKNEQITVIQEIQPDLQPFSGFRVDFESVLINLITNAIEAMREVKNKDRIIKISCSSKSDMLTLKLSDSGAGIPPANRDIIFEPFWTSKGREGTGLGLTIIKEIVLQYEGSVSVIDSELDSGATFLISLPVYGD